MHCIPSQVSKKRKKSITLSFLPFLYHICLIESSILSKSEKPFEVQLTNSNVQPKFQHNGFNICTCTFSRYLGSLKARIVNGVDFAATNTSLF